MHDPARRQQICPCFRSSADIASSGSPATGANRFERALTGLNRFKRALTSVVSEVLQQTLDTTVVVGVAACNWGIRMTTELEGKNQTGTASFEDSVTQKEG